MLKAMANLIRPPSDRRTTRHTKSRSPPPAQVAKPTAHTQQQPQPILTRRLSKNITIPPRALDTPNARPPKQPSPARAGTRKRSIAEVDTPDARPPLKKTQRRSHGEWPATTNALTKKLHFHVDHVQCRASTPKPTVQEQTSSAMVDQKSLRSRDPNSKKVSELKEIFDDYEAIIADWEDRESSLDSDEQISIVDEPLSNAERAVLEQAAADARASRLPTSATHAYTGREPLDYTMYANALPTTEDLLADDVYTKVHGKHETEEKRSRNREKEMSQHQKSTLERLLDELEGDEWPKVFVLAGTANERNDWESRRRYFARELRILLDKHDDWKRKEKEGKDREKEKRRQEKEREEKKRKRDEGEDSEEESDSEPKRKRNKGKEPIRPSPLPSPPKPRRPSRPHGFMLEYDPPSKKLSIFKSFFQKGTRPSSLSNKSRSTRSTDAPPFGIPLPPILARIADANLPQALVDDNAFERNGEPVEEVLEEDERRFWGFGLGVGFVTREFLRENERVRRRRKRESKGEE